MIASKEQWKEVDLYEMKWQQDAMQKAINEKKEQAEEEVLNDWVAEIIKYRDNGELTDKEINSMLKHIIKEVRQIERMV